MNTTNNDNVTISAKTIKQIAEWRLKRKITKQELTKISTYIENDIVEHLATRMIKDAIAFNDITI